jgi:PadR family transcriptional regulator, regulatory protein PadR
LFRSCHEYLLARKTTNPILWRADAHGKLKDVAAIASSALDVLCRMFYPHVSKVEATMSSAKFPIPQGTLDMLILQILSLEPAHGYAIAQRLQQISRDTVQVNQGSLYPALHRLEQKRWLKADWRQSETGREAKFYAMTPAGRRQLAVEKESWNKLTAAVRLIFNEGK